MTGVGTSGHNHFKNVLPTCWKCQVNIVLTYCFFLFLENLIPFSLILISTFFFEAHSYLEAAMVAQMSVDMVTIYWNMSNL